MSIRPLRWASLTAPVSVLLLLAACAGAPPEILENDGTFVTVSQPRHTSQRAVKALAQESCAAQGKRAQFLSQQCVDPQCSTKAQKFWCQ